MNREDIIRMAREAGFMNVQGGLMDNGELSDYWDCWPGQLERFAALVAAHEREECAKDADCWADQLAGQEIAAAIRAREGK